MEYTVKNLLSPYIYNDIASVYHKDSFDCFRNKTVFITGAGQLLGYYLACAFLIGNDVDNNNTKILLCDKEKSLFEKFGNLNSRTDIDFLIRKTYNHLPLEKADYVIHADTRKDSHTFEAMENLLNYAQQKEDSSVILCMNTDIYGNVYNGKSKLTEDDKGYIDLSKADSYPAQTQRMVEVYGKKLSAEKGLNIKFARLCPLLGAMNSNPLSKFITPSLMDKNNTVARGLALIDDDLNTIKSYCYVTDAAIAVLKILTEGRSGEVYNVSTGCDTNLKYIAEIFQQLIPDVDVAYKCKNISNNYDISPMSSTRLILDNSRLLSLGYSPQVGLADAIKRTVKIIKENFWSGGENNADE